MGGFACNRSLDFLANFLARVKGAPPLARVEVDGSELVVSFSVRQQQDGAWYYNTVTSKDVQNKTPVASPRDTPIAGERATSANTGASKEKAQDSYGRLDRQAGSSVAPIAGLSGFIRRPLAQINPEAVSRVVDPDTGGNEGGDALTYFDAYASNYGLAAQIWLAIPARNCGALAGLQKQSCMDALALLALPPQAAAVQIERSASEVQHLATGYINRLEIEPVGH